MDSDTNGTLAHLVLIPGREAYRERILRLLAPRPIGSGALGGLSTERANAATWTRQGACIRGRSHCAHCGIHHPLASRLSIDCHWSPRI